MFFRGIRSCLETFSVVIVGEAVVVSMERVEIRGVRDFSVFGFLV